MDLLPRGRLNAGNDREPFPRARFHHGVYILSRIMVTYRYHIQTCLAGLPDYRRRPHFSVAARRKARVQMQVGPYYPHHPIPVTPSSYSLPTNSNVGISLIIMTTPSSSAFSTVSCSGSLPFTKTIPARSFIPATATMF